MEYIAGFFNYADILWRAFDVTWLILLILLLRKMLGEQLLPKTLRRLWGFAALRIFLPITAPVYKGLYCMLHLDHLYPYIEAWVSQMEQNAWVSWYESSSDSVLAGLPYHIWSSIDNLFFYCPLSILLGVIWLLGAFTVTIIFIIQNICFYRLVDANGRIYGIRDNLPVYTIHDRYGSCLSGIANPKIYISEAVIEDTNQAEWIVRHELQHYRAKDHWYGLARSLCLIMMWFHPLVWYGAKLSREDCELNCDDLVLQNTDETSCMAYGKCLIAMAAKNKRQAMKPSIAASHLNRISLKKRVERIARHTELPAGETASDRLANGILLLNLILCIISG